MKILTFDGRRVALGLSWFARRPSGSWRGQARGLARRLEWSGPLAVAERPGPIAQLGLAPHDASLPSGVRALAPAGAATEAGDLLVVVRLDTSTGWILAVRRGHILVHGDRVVPWEERAPVLEELRAHLDDPRTLVEEDAQQAQSLLETFSRASGPCLKTLGLDPWRIRTWGPVLFAVLAAGALLVPGSGSRQGRRPPPPSPGAAARRAFLRLWREGRSPAVWRRLCLRPLLALPLVRRGRALEAITCTPEGLVARYRPLEEIAWNGLPSPPAPADGHGIVTRRVSVPPRSPLPRAESLRTPVRADAEIDGLLALVGRPPSRSSWRTCLGRRRGLPTSLARLRCRSVRVPLGHDPEARLRLLLRALVPAADVRVRRLVARLSPPSWTLEVTLYAEAS